jgi:hypothetical protein
MKRVPGEINAPGDGNNEVKVVDVGCLDLYLYHST